MMSEQLGTALSALVDDEAGEQDIQLVLEHLDDPVVRQTWTRFQAASQSLDGGAAGDRLGIDISGAVMTAIAAESLGPARPEQPGIDPGGVVKATAAGAVNQELGAALSALVDDEADEQDLHLVLDTLHDPAVRQTWARFQAARQSLDPGAREDIPGIDISAGVMAAIADEQAHSTPVDSVVADTPAVIRPVGFWQQVRGPAAGFAIAASMFMAVLVGSQFFDAAPVGGDYPGATLAGAESRSPALPPSGVVNIGGSAQLADFSSEVVTPSQPGADYDAIARKRLQRYLLPHTEEAALNAQQGMMPFARVASFRTEATGPAREQRAAPTAITIEE